MSKRFLLAALLPIALVSALLFAQPAEGKKYALLVGVQRYSDATKLRNLDYTEKDVTDLAAVLEKQGYRVTILTRSEAKNQDKDFLRPTAKNIKQQLESIGGDCKANDTLLVAFTGHGAHLKSTDKLYFCPQETDLADEKTLIAVDDVMAALNKTNCKAASKVFLMDACRNDPADGATGSTPNELKSSTMPLVPDPPGGTVAMFSCSKGQISHESATHKRGFLFHHIIEGLSGKAASKKTGEVTWLGLAQYVAEELPDAVKKDKGPLVKQTPEIRGDARAMVLAKYDPEKAGTTQTIPKTTETGNTGGATETANLKGGEERSFEIADGVKMVFCWVPPGKATLGSPDREQNRSTNETEHEYSSKGFWLGKYTVTQKEYESVIGSNPSAFAKTGSDADYRNRVEGMDTSRFPVEKVSWDDCQAFLKKCKLKGLKLPHEDEWEYACRGAKGNKQPFYWGDELNGDKANCNGNYPYGTSTKGAYLTRTSEVGSYAKSAPHPWGLCDMSGNVWQWCDNWYDSEQKYRVLRGGSWYNFPQGCRAAPRIRYEPDYRDIYIGFRVCFRLD